MDIRGGERIGRLGAPYTVVFPPLLPKALQIKDASRREVGRNSPTRRLLRPFDTNALFWCLWSRNRD